MHHSILIHNSQILRTAQIPIDRRMDHQIVVYSDGGTVQNSKKEQTIDTHNDMDESRPLC